MLLSPRGEPGGLCKEATKQGLLEPWPLTELRLPSQDTEQTPGPRLKQQEVAEVMLIRRHPAMGVSEKTSPWPPRGKDPVGPGVQARLRGCL